MVTQLQTASLGTVLGVWAHPDDETYLSGLLMAAARAAGNRVVVVSATAGERGTPHPIAHSPHRLAAVRREELASALRELGVEEHVVLGFADGGCDLVPAAAGAEAIAAQIVRVRPDTIVTFGPEGMTGHADHRAVARWVVDAVERTGSAARVLQATVTPSFHRRWGVVNERVGLWDPDVPPPCTPEPEVLAVKADRGDLRRKVRALRAHRSQTAALEQQLGARTFRAWWSTEWFAEASLVGAGAGAGGVTTALLHREPLRASEG